jgi:hypothetical protein
LFSVKHQQQRLNESKRKSIVWLAGAKRRYTAAIHMFHIQRLDAVGAMQCERCLTTDAALKGARAHAAAKIVNFGARNKLFDWTRLTRLAFPTQ